MHNCTNKTRSQEIKIKELERKMKKKSKSPDELEEQHMSFPLEMTRSAQGEL